MLAIKKETPSKLLARKFPYKAHCIKARKGATSGHVITKS